MQDPMIRNVRIEGQKGEWHWNTVMTKTDDSYHLIDGLTGTTLPMADTMGAYRSSSKGCQGV